MQQTFNDGVVMIYSVSNIAGQGNMPKERLTLKIGPLRYEERIVGMGRFWTAQQAKTQIDRMIRVHKLSVISPQDIAIPLNGGQYRIRQVQYVPNAEPPVMDLSLERVEANYDIA